MLGGPSSVARASQGGCGLQCAGWSHGCPGKMLSGRLAIVFFGYSSDAAEPLGRNVARIVFDSFGSSARPQVDIELGPGGRQMLSGGGRWRRYRLEVHGHPRSSCLSAGS